MLDSNGAEIDRMVGGRSTRGLIQDLELIFENPIPYSELSRQARISPFLALRWSDHRALGQT